jgi:hypothetical protein
VLDRRALNRATLERQLLLEPSGMRALDALERSIGLNAQDPNPPYISLWARLRGFRRDELTGLMADRRGVRSSVLRGTQHLVTADFGRPMVVDPSPDVMIRRYLAAFGLPGSWTSRPGPD